MGNPAFTPEELQRLKDTVLLLEKYKFSDAFGDTAGALQKVIDVIDIGIQEDAADARDFISPEKIPHIKGSEYLAAIIRAIKKKEVIRIYYQPFYEDKPYFVEIHPYLLKEYKHRWYLLGLNDFKKQLRTYSLDRIRDIQQSDLSYEDRSIQASEYFKNSIGIIAPAGNPPRIKIAVQKTQAQYMITQAWHDSQNIEEETEDEVIFSFRIHPTYELISLLLSYGKDLRVLEPESLKESMFSQLEAMREFYTDLE